MIWNFELHPSPQRSKISHSYWKKTKHSFYLTNFWNILQENWLHQKTRKERKKKNLSASLYFLSSTHLQLLALSYPSNGLLPPFACIPLSFIGKGCIFLYFILLSFYFYILYQHDCHFYSFLFFQYLFITSLQLCIPNCFSSPLFPLSIPIPSLFLKNIYKIKLTYCELI